MAATLHVILGTGPAGAWTARALRAAVVYQALHPPYDKWPELFPPLQRAALEAARAAGARCVSSDNLYGYGRVDGTLTERTPQQPNTKRAGSGRR
jgi:hypothetical protein